MGCITSDILGNAPKQALATGQATGIKGSHGPQQSLSLPPSSSSSIQIHAPFLMNNTNSNNNFIMKHLAMVSEVYAKSIPEYSEFIEKIVDQLLSSPAYNNIIDAKYVVEIAEESSIRYYTHQQTAETLQIILDFMAESKNIGNNHQNLEVKYKENYNKEVQERLEQQTSVRDFFMFLAEKWNKIKNQAFFTNKEYLRILSYIVQTKEQTVSQYGHCFWDLKFDFSDDQVRKVAAAVKRMCKYDVRAFSYLSNYLLLCCKQMEKRNSTLKDIEIKLISTLEMLSAENKPNKPLDGLNQLFNKHESFEKRVEIKDNFLDIKRLPQNQRSKAIKDFIYRFASLSEDKIKQFYSMVVEACDNLGTHFKYNVKLKAFTKNTADTNKSYQRTKEKLLSSYLQRNNIQFNKYSVERDQKTSNSTSMQEYIQREEKYYEQQVQKVYDLMDKPLQFTVSDMLRGKCLFISVDKINSCCDMLKKEVGKYTNAQIVEIDNRLKSDKGTSDLVLKIRVGQTIAELQLAIDSDDIAAYEFSHKIYQLLRSPFFSPLMMLKRFNSELSEDFFAEMQAVTQANTKNKENYEEKVTFKDIKQVFLKFAEKISYGNIVGLKHKNMIDFSRLNEQVIHFEKIKLQVSKVAESNKIHYNNGFYLAELTRNEEAIEELYKYFEKQKNAEEEYNEEQVKDIQKMKKMRNQKQRQVNVYKHLGNIYDSQGNYEKAIEFYIKCLEIQQKIQGKGCIDSACTLNNIGLVYCSQGNYSKAIEFFLKSLEIEQKIKGKGCIDSATTLRNIGLVYDNKGNYQQAIEYYMKSLQIFQKIKGKSCIDSASTLNNIGLVYFSQGIYQKAIEYYMKSLEIFLTIKGKGCIDSANTLNNIGLVYNSRGNYEKAIEYYMQNLEIVQKIKGKGCIDSADTINNIGSVYYKHQNYQKVIEYYMKSLEIQQKIKGKGCIDSATTLSNIGLVYCSQGNYQKAIEYYIKGMEIIQKIKGKSCIDSADILNNIGSVYGKQGNYQKSIEYYMKSLEILQRIKGKGCIDSADLLNNIGNVYYGQKSYQQAIEFYMESLGIYQKIKGKGCIDSASNFNNIGSVYNSQRNYEKAIEYYMKSLQIQQKIIGKGCIDSACTFKNIGQVYDNQGNYEKTIEYYMKSLQIVQKIKGKGCIDSASTLNNIGLVYYNHRNYQKAIEYFMKNLEIVQKIKGKGCIDSANTLKSIGGVYYNQGNYQNAMELFMKCLEIEQRTKGKGCIDSAGILNNIGLVHKRQGNNQKANEYFNIAKKIIQKGS